MLEVKTDNQTERGVSAHLVHCRLRSGWPVNDRLFMPSLRTSLGA